MNIKIFDVAHGFCAYIVADNGNVILVDCGHNDILHFYPADYLLKNGCTGIERFFPLNYDEDHLSGLPRLRQFESRIPIHILHRNTSITPDQLKYIKRQSGCWPLGPGVSALVDMLESYNSQVTSPPEFPSLGFEVFFNSYPEFSDTNNLSQVLFLHYPGVSIVFPGDMEKPGWETLLRNPSFRSNLARVNIFVASHHGRESGYCREVFDYCRPEIIVISDEEIQYESQEHTYDEHARGITWNQTGIRKVLTTRKDGMIDISSRPGGYFVTTNK